MIGRTARQEPLRPSQKLGVGCRRSRLGSADAVTGLSPLLGVTNRESVTAVFQTMLAPLALAGAAQLIRKALGDDWAELARRIPA